MICGKCGKTLSDTAKFCDKCGAKVEQEVVQVQTMEGQKSELKKPLVIAALALLVVLVIGKTISSLGAIGSKSDKGLETWSGYTAELERGKRVKTATYVEKAREDNAEATAIQFVYDIAGNLSSAHVADLGQYEWEDLYEICRDKLPLDIKENPLDESTDTEPYKTPIPMEYGVNYYEYNEGVNTVTWRIDGNSYSTAYSYNDDNRVTCKLLTNNEGQSEKYLYTYDSQGRVTSVDFSGTQNYRTTMEYDESGNMTCTTKYDGEGNLEFTYTQTFDEENRITYKRWAGKANLFGMRYDAEKIYDYSYDEQGNLIKLRCNSYSEEYGYDKAGNQTEIRHYNEEGVHEYTHMTEYDKNGNVLKYQEYAIYGDQPYLKKQTEYKYNKAGDVAATRNSSYSYEANSDYSVVNQIEAQEGEWQDEDVEAYDYEWVITYYTDEEWEQYQHDLEFTEL